MKPTAIFALAIAGAAGCAGGHGPTAVAPSGAAPTEVVAAAKATIEQWRQATEVRSPDALEKLYAHDLDVVIVQEGTAHLGWSDVKTVIDERVGMASAIHVRLKDVQVASVAPTAATAVAQMTREITTGTTAVTETGTLTLVLRHDAAGWVITSEHYSYKR